MSTIYRTRREQLLTAFTEQGIGAGLITSPTNVAYLTGFMCNPHERFMGLLLNADSKEAVLFVPLLDQDAAVEAGFEGEIVPISDTQDAYAILGGRLSASLGTFGVEKHALSMIQGETLGLLLPNTDFEDLETAILGLRLYKSDEEIVKVRHAIDIIERVVDYAAVHAKVGMSEIDLTAELEYQMRKLGADRPAFESIVLTGTRSALPHGKPGAAKLTHGDYLLIDIGVQADGYCSDITRTFVIGEATKEQERIYETVLAANMAGIAQAEAGVTLASLDAAAREVIVEAGYGSYFTHRVGHGFGMDVHESPSLHGNNQELVRNGLLFTIEPGIYVPEIGGVRIEDDVYIRSDGKAEVLTSYPKTLRVLGG
ncbi:Xaa-Pro dipeptidase [Paenibacillus phyllosphaerae]|uniref:Xaa-Pro dipeptidase n=1 Tax=Paenibacillus phyllosphaerae TaxID=274593 RepID=A0A7W5AUC4_9BACL|nr:Xaa-Pro peptidase family protein [Paenibacillus phyllosphaerae]MBB3108321.1 Xaa-Pro dipeptidase [Paenibacillus phyllosphaerae]